MSSVTSKFDEWPWKTTGHLFYANWSFVHNLIAIAEFKMELQSGNVRFYATSSHVNHFIAIDQFKLELQSRNAQFGSKSTIFCPVWPWNLTDDLENNMASFLCYFNFCASFHSHLGIQTGVTVRKRPNLGKKMFWPLWPCLWPLTSTIHMDITLDHDNNSWKCHDDTMRGTLW